MRQYGLSKSQLSQTFSITGKELEDLTGYIAESIEIIDNLVTGNNDTFEQLVSRGLIVKAIKRFMKKHKKFVPVTQAENNRLERIEEGIDGVSSGITTGSDNAALESVS